MNYVSPEKLANDLQQKADLQVIDIRENYEYEFCNINSLHIPMAEIPFKAKELEPKLRTVVVCRTGQRAAAVANFLEANFDFHHIEVLDGGILGYAQKVDNKLDTEY
jgi:adenylyltransferase/sulfurtransferase